MDARRTLWLVVLASGLAGGVAAQEPPEFRLPPGARVRMTVEGSRVEGYLSGREGDSLRLTLPGDNPLIRKEIDVPVSAATRVEVHFGRRRHTGKGALIGAVALGLTGIWDPVDRSASCGASSSAPCSRAEAVAIATLAGAALGALVGHAIQSDQWAPVALDSLAVLPSTPNEIREAPGGPGIPAGSDTPARVKVRF